jgi:hypothetical protein
MGKPRLQVCRECGQSKRLKAFRAGRAVCKDCSSQARHPDRGVKESFIRPAVIEGREEQLCRELWSRTGRTPRDPNDNTIHEHNRYTSELFPDSDGYIADHVSSQVGRLITRPTIGPIYKASKGPYDTRFLAKVHHRYLGNGKHLSTQILGQMVASQHGGRGVGEAIANDKYGTVIERVHHMAVTGHQQDAISEEAWLDQYIGLWFDFRKPDEDSPGYKSWKQEMSKARSIHSDSLMADVLEELKSIPVNEHNEQPWLTSDSGPFGRTVDQYYNRSRPIEEVCDFT